MSFGAVLRHYQSINALARSLINRPAFDDIHVLHPDPSRPEPGFIRATSWLYCLYFEAGRVSIDYLVSLGEIFQVIDRNVANQHIEVVRSLRTELHHNLGFEDTDQQARTTAEVWRRGACGTSLPEAENQWGGCYQKLVGDSNIFLRSIEDVVRQIESDSNDADNHLAEWTRRLIRSWPGASFDPLIEDAKRRLGRNALNAVAFRNRHLYRWRKQLELLDDNFDFDREATLLIEKTLLEDDSAVLSISGRDIMEQLQIEAGPLVGRLLQEAKRYYESNGCNPEEILEHIHEYYLDQNKA